MSMLDAHTNNMENTVFKSISTWHSYSLKENTHKYLITTDSASINNWQSQYCRKFWSILFMSYIVLLHYRGNMDEKTVSETWIFHVCRGKRNLQNKRLNFQWTQSSLHNWSPGLYNLDSWWRLEASADCDHKPNALRCQPAC